jgi:hypothetical protein
MAILTREQKVEKINELEIEIGKLEKEQACRYGNLFPKILKLTRKLQKLRNSL